jgi:ribosome-associated translation inhibitor RaiA
MLSVLARRSSLSGVLLLVASLAALTVVAGLPLAITKPLAEARQQHQHQQLAASEEPLQDVVAIQMAETVEHITQQAVAAGHAVPHIIPLNVKARTEQEEEDFFALIDEHHDNLEQGQQPTKRRVRAHVAARGGCIWRSIVMRIRSHLCLGLFLLLLVVLQAWSCTWSWTSP